MKKKSGNELAWELVTTANCWSGSRMPGAFILALSGETREEVKKLTSKDFIHNWAYSLAGKAGDS